MKKSNRGIAFLTLILIAVSTNTIVTPTFAEADHVEKALSLKRRGDLEGALKEFEKALQQDPNDNVALIDRALLRFDSLGDHKGGFDDINQALKVNMIDANALRTRANFKAETGDAAGALADYRDALKWRPNDAPSYVNRGILYAQLGKTDLALADFTKAIALNNDLTAQFNRIRLLSDKKAAGAGYEKLLRSKVHSPDDYLAQSNAHAYFGYKEKAIAVLNLALINDASYSVAYYNRAVLQAQLGDDKAALADYNKYIELNQNNPKAYYNRSLLREKMNDREGAMNDLKRALELEPQLKLRQANPTPFSLMLS